jgi:hypothetical protein
MMMPKTKSGQYNKLETEIIDSLNLDDSKNLIFKFSKKDSPIFIQLTYSSISLKNANRYVDNFGTLRIGDAHSKNDFKELFFGKKNQIWNNILNILFNIIQIVFKLLMVKQC